jgi:hypothetical protein
VWTAVVAAICYKIVDLVVGLRVSEEEEREEACEGEAGVSSVFRHRAWDTWRNTGRAAPKLHTNPTPWIGLFTIVRT